MPSYEFEFDTKKNLALKKTRGISFEEIILLIGEGCLLDVVQHPNVREYPHQSVYVIDVEGYVYLVPFEQEGERIFLKTIYPSRKATKEYLNKGKKQ